MIEAVVDLLIDFYKKEIENKVPLEYQMQMLHLTRYSQAACNRMVRDGYMFCESEKFEVYKLTPLGSDIRKVLVWWITRPDMELERQIMKSAYHNLKKGEEPHPAYVRPGMYAGNQGNRTIEQW